MALALAISTVWSPGLAEAKNRKVSIAINAAAQRDPINPFIYGQFIEHLGRCIYGGIWAEMLEDRKFYFPITAVYDPYQTLQETPFPVVGASPWQILGDPARFIMDASDPFVGKHTPVLRKGCGIAQHDLAIVKGKQYVGYLWMKGRGKVAVKFAPNLTDLKLQTLAEIALSVEYKQHAFQFVAEESSDSASLQVEVNGNGIGYVGTISLMPADNVRGMRRDTLTLLKQLNAPMYRWPGGNFVSGYEWRDGIGPRDRRPPRKNPAWTGVEHNDVGIAEFLDFCREVRAEPLIAANTGFGDPHSAAAEVEYCNGSTKTYGGRLRLADGRSQPYNIRYWCVGNEMFGAWQLGYMQLQHYTLKHNRCAEAMRRADPSIELIGVGELGGKDKAHDPGRKLGWSETMLRECADHMEFISEHFYRGQVPWTEQGPSKSVVAHVDALRSAIRDKANGHRKLQDRLGLVGDKRIPIAMDEWNYWHRDYAFGELGCRYDLADALGIAAGLHEYFRNTDIVQMAHYAQTVNVIGCIKTTKTDAFLSTTALPLMTYRAHFGNRPIDTQIEGETHNLDAVAALTSDGKALTIGVVNPNPEPVAVQLNIRGASTKESPEQWLVAGDDPTSYNDVGETRIDVIHETLKLGDEWLVPAYCFAILKAPIE
nr:alpha-L-arabinofuranosidase [uncultured bacterium]